jgi:uncharacterized protein YjbI with pentapeptide repeats
MKPYSKDLRLRVLAAVDRGMPRKEVSRIFGVSEPTIRRYLGLRRQTDTTSQALAAPIRAEVATNSQSLNAKRCAFIVNSLPLVYDSQYNPMDEEHPQKRKKSRWWPTSRGAMRIFAALKAVGALLFTGVGALLFFISVSTVATLDDEILLVLGAATALAAVVVLIRVGQHYRWTGFGESVQPKLDNQEIQPRKTLWDWLQLFIVPLALAAIGLWFAAQQDAHQQQIEDRRAESDRRIEEQRAQDAALQAYLDQMSQLMLEGNLRGSKEGSEARTLARARTRTILVRLDSRRKGSVVQFLYEASLINKDDPVVSLSAVSLRGADLSGATLSGADLVGADLSGTNLSGADLSDADLSVAHLRKANLSSAVLSGADLSDAELQLADLSETDLISADLSGAKLSGAILIDAVLYNADIGDGAYLFHADLRGAELNGADLRTARLNGAKGVTEEQLEEQTNLLEGATMPGGSIHR